MAYTKILRRIRDSKTNYNKRKNMLIGHKDFVTVQISNENTHVQIHQPELTGDKVISSAGILSPASITPFNAAAIR